MKFENPVVTGNPPEGYVTEDEFMSDVKENIFTFLTNTEMYMYKEQFQITIQSQNQINLLIAVYSIKKNGTKHCLYRFFYAVSVLYFNIPSINFVILLNSCTSYNLVRNTIFPFLSIITLRVIPASRAAYNANILACGSNPIG